MFVVSLIEFSLRVPQFSNRYGRSYQFNVTDLELSDSSFHSLKVGSSRSQGEYKILLPDNRWQIVSYVADDKGYRATVRYETVDHQPISEETQGGSETYWAGSVGTPSLPQRIPGPALPSPQTSKAPSYYLKPSRPEPPQREQYPVVSQVNTYVIHPAPDDPKEKWSSSRPTYYPPAPTVPPVRPSPRDPYIPQRPSYEPQGPPIVPIKRPPATIGTYRPRPHVGYQVPVALSGLPAPPTTTATPEDDDEIEGNMRFNPNQFHPFWEPQAEKPDVIAVPLQPVQRPVEEKKRPVVPPEHRPPPPTPPQPEPTLKPHVGYSPAHSGYPKPHSGYSSEEEDTPTKRPVHANTQSYKQAHPGYPQQYNEPTKPTSHPDYSYNHRPSEPQSYGEQIRLPPTSRPEYYRPQTFTEPPTAIYHTTAKYSEPAPFNSEPNSKPDYYRPQSYYEPPKSSHQTTEKYSPPDPLSYNESPKPDYYRPATYTEPPTAVYQPTTPKYGNQLFYPGRPAQQPAYQPAEPNTKWSKPLPEQPEYSDPYPPSDYYTEPLRVKPDPYAFDPFDSSFTPTEGPYGNYRLPLTPPQKPQQIYQQPYDPPSYEPPPYKPPSYEPPSYEPPSYEPPSYEQPPYEPTPYEPPQSFNKPQISSPVVASLPEEVEAPAPEEPIPVFDDNMPPKNSFDGPLFYRPSFARGKTSTTTTAAPATTEHSALLSKFKFRPKSKLTTSDGFGTRTQPLKRTKGQSTSTETIVYDWQDPASFLPDNEATKYDVDDPYSSKDQYEIVPEEVTTKSTRRPKIKAKTTTTTTEQPAEYYLEPYYDLPTEVGYDSPYETSHKIPYDAPYESSYDAYDTPVNSTAESSVEADKSADSSLEPTVQEQKLELPTTTVAPTTVKATTISTTELTTEADITTSTTTATPTTTKRKRKKNKKRLRPKGSRKSKYRPKSKTTTSTESSAEVSSESTDATTTTSSTSTTTTETTTTETTTTKRPTRIRFPPRIKYVAKSDRVVRQHSYNSNEDELAGDAAESMSSAISRRNDDESHVIAGFDMDTTLNSIPIDRLALVDFDEVEEEDEEEED